MADLLLTWFPNSTITGTVTYGINWHAQTFYVPHNTTLKTVKVYIKRFGSPSGDFIVSIRATSDGLPTGGDLASASVSASSISSTNTQWVSFSFNLELSANTTYAIVVRCPNGDGSNYISWLGHSSNLYPAGQRCNSGDSGSSWSVTTTNDLSFAVIGTISTDTANLKEEKEHTLSEPSSLSIYGTNYKAGLYFKTSSEYSLTKIRVPLTRIGTISGNITANVYEADANHKPTGSSLGSSSVACLSIAGYNYVIQYTTFEFSTPIDLQGNKEYCIVLNCGGDASNYVKIWSSYSSVFSYFGIVYTTNGGSTWGVSDTQDPTFLAWGIAKTPPPTNLSCLPTTYKTSVQVKARYKANGSEEATYVRIQIASDSTFSNVIEDTTQIEIDPLSPDEYYTRIIDWFSSSEGTYYFRVAFWNSDNYTTSPNWTSDYFVVSYPVVSSLDHTSENEVFEFTADIQDYYSATPIVTLVIDSRTYVMELTGRSGNQPYLYTYRKQLELERGTYNYHLEIGNVWTTQIEDDRVLAVHYTLKGTPEISIYSGNQKINAWNISLTEQALPDFSELTFMTDRYLDVFQVSVRVRTNTVKYYTFEIDRCDKTDEGYSVSATERAKNDLRNVVSFSTQATSSINLLRSLLKTYKIKGYELPEVVYLQAFENEEISNILNRLLILNNALGYAKNGVLYLYDLTNSDYKFRVSRDDAGVEFTSEPHAVINKVREYYLKKFYPVPASTFTDYDASNWTGTMSDEQMTATGLTSPNGYSHILKGSGTISRSCSFSFTDFDTMLFNWCPGTASSIEIRLETDDSNYRKYVRSFAGEKGSGFVLTSSNPSDEVYKTITFSASKKIHYVDVSISNTCEYKIVLLLNGNTVADTGYMTITGSKRIYFQNIDCDTIKLYFTKFYPVGTGYGVECYKLEIEEYKQEYVRTGTEERIVWHNKYEGSIRAPASHVETNGVVYHTISLGSVPPLLENQKYRFEQGYCYVRYIDGATGQETQYHGSISAYVENGTLYATLTVVFPYTGTMQARVYYYFDYYKVQTVSTGEYVWVYSLYTWQQTYNLWDSASVPFSQFSTVGSPTSQVNSIKFIASGNYYLDNIYFLKANPAPQYVEAENTESMLKGVRFQERKTDGWSSKESALAFALALVNIFGTPPKSYSKEVSLKTDVEIGDLVLCDDDILPVYKIHYDFDGGYKRIFMGRSISNTLEFMKETSRKIEALQKTIF